MRKIVLAVDHERKLIMEAADLHAQRREAHADTVARLEQRVAQLVRDRQASGPLHLNGFTLRKADSHNHVEPNTEEDEAKYLEAAIRASLSFQRSQEQLLETPKSMPRDQRVTQTAPPKYGHLVPSDCNGGEEAGATRDCLLNESRSDADPAGRSAAAGGAHDRHFNGSAAPSLAPNSEPRRRGCDDRQRCADDLDPSDSRRRGGGVHGLALLPPNSAPLVFGHTPLSPTSVHRAFAQNSGNSMAISSRSWSDGSSQRPALSSSAVGEWFDDLDEHDPEPPPAAQDPAWRVLAEVGGHTEGKHEGVLAQVELVSPQKMEAVNCLHNEGSSDFIDGDVTDADRMSDHDTGGEEEPPDPRQWGRDNSDDDDMEASHPLHHHHHRQSVKRAQARSAAGRDSTGDATLLNEGREGAVTPPLPATLESELWHARSTTGRDLAPLRTGIALPSAALPDQGEFGSGARLEEMLAGRSGGSGRARRSVKPAAPKKVVVNVQTQTKTFRVLVTPNDSWAHLCALVQSEMAFKDPPQLSCDGWAREPKPFTLIKVSRS